MTFENLVFAAETMGQMAQRLDAMGKQGYFCGGVAIDPKTGLFTYVLCKGTIVPITLRQVF